MSLAANNKAFLSTYYGKANERRNRPGLDYDYQIRLRKSQCERMDEVRINNQKQKLERDKNRKDFLLKNLVNQRWAMSLQWVYQKLQINSTQFYSQGTNLTIYSGQQYSRSDTRINYVKALVKLRKEKASKNLENEFRNPLYVPLRGLDEDENDRDYMMGKEIRRELRNTADFEIMFDKYVCEREEVADQLGRDMECMGLGGRALTGPEVEEGLGELVIERKEGQSDDEFFTTCLEHSWAILSNLNTPDLSGVEDSFKENQQKSKIIQNLNFLVELFKNVYRAKITDLDSSIFALALSHHILNLNHFWTDIRDFMRDENNNGLKSIVLNIGLQTNSQLIQEALVEFVYDLSFSDFEGQKVNKILYQECLEVIERWLSTRNWNSQQTFSCFMELLKDVFLSQAVYIKPKEQKHQFSFVGKNEDSSDSEEEKKEEEESEEEEKEMEHGMEDIGGPFELKSRPKQQLEKKEAPESGLGGDDKMEIYHRKDDNFLSFICKILFNLLNIDYRLNIDAPSFSDLLENSRYSKEPEGEEEINEHSQKEEELNQEKDLDIETLKQVQLEDDGIIIGSETTTEPSEYSEDLIDDEDIDLTVSNLIGVISCFFHGLVAQSYSLNNKVYTVDPTKLIKDKKIEIKVFLSFMENWLNNTKSATKTGQNRFKYIQKFNILGRTSTCYDKYLLTKLKFSQFYQMDAERQLDFLENLDQTDIDDANFQVEDFKEDIILSIFRRGLQNIGISRKVYKIMNFQDGLWGEFFFFEALSQAWAEHRGAVQ